MKNVDRTGGGGDTQTIPQRVFAPVKATAPGGVAAHWPVDSIVEPGLGAPPQLFVIIDTEEEFDWSAPYSRSNQRISAMRHIGRAQAIFDRFEVFPTYVVDYPVASQKAGIEPLVDIRREGRCSIGAHLHPWVNPPYAEELNPPNSFASNLPASLQRDKIQVLASTIEQQIGERPRVFKAGRYGIAPTTVEVLDELGFEVDASVCPRFDFTREGGPSFAALDARPFFLTPRLLEVPCTVDYVGWAGSFRPAVHRLASWPSLATVRMAGLLGRIHAVERIMLSPEGSTLDDMKRLARSLVRRGLRTFTLTFHSPSVEPGHTPYVRSARDLQVFLAALEGFCEFFMTALGGRPGTVLEFRTAITTSSGTA